METTPFNIRTSRRIITVRPRPLVMKVLATIGVMSLLLLVGCVPRTALEEASRKLRPEMSRAQVDRLFSGFRVTEYTNMLQMQYAQVFKTNAQPAIRVMYDPEEIKLLQRVENCEVYFDTNGILIGFRYSGS